MINNSNDFANALKTYETKQEGSFRMATVTNIKNSKVYLTFYGEETEREKSYKRLSSYTPAKNDTVICAMLNGSYTILGKVVE